MGKNLSRHLLVVMVNVDPEVEEEFNEWYNTEHIPALMKVQGAISGERYVSEDGPLKYMAIYEVENPNVVESAAWKKAGDTEWTRKMRPHLKDVTRIVYEKTYP